MAKLVYKERKTPVLTKVPLTCITDYYNINITGGCIFGCIYCYAQGYSSNPKNGTVTFYHNTFERLRRELPRKRERPRIVYFSSASEPFAPFAPALDELYKVIDLLMKNNVNIFISTKGRIPDRFLELFSPRPELVHVQVGITTTDEKARKVFEPYAAPIKQRLMNIERLNSVRVFTEARLDPLLPGITDGEESLMKLFSALAEAGINNAISSYLFLRTSNRKRLRSAYEQFNLNLDRFFHGSKINYCRGGEVDITSKHYRSVKYEKIIEIAQDAGIRIKLCHCRNPDLTDQVCHPQTDDFQIAKQLTLFQF